MTQRQANVVMKRQELVHRRTVSQQTNRQRSRTANHLTRNQHERTQISRELHPDQPPTQLAANSPLPRIAFDLNQHAAPLLQVPRQRSKHHVGTVALKIMQWCLEAMTSFELRKCVLLVAATIRAADHLASRQGLLRLVRDIEEVTNLVVIEQTLLTAVAMDLLTNHHHAIAATASGGTVIELGIALTGKNQIPIAFLDDDFFARVVAPVTWLAALPRVSLECFPPLFVERISDPDKIREDVIGAWSAQAER